MSFSLYPDSLTCHSVYILNCIQRQAWPVTRAAASPPRSSSVADSLHSCGLYGHLVDILSSTDPGPHSKCTHSKVMEMIQRGLTYS